MDRSGARSAGWRHAAGPERASCCCFSTHTIAWSARQTRWRGSISTGSTRCWLLARRSPRPTAEWLGSAGLYLARGRRPSRVSRPARTRPQDRDLVWIGNWGDDERAAELREFLIEPVSALGIIGASARRALPGRRPGRAGRSRDRLCRLSSQFRGAARLCRGADDRPRPAPALCATAPGHSDYPYVRGARLRDSAGLGAVGRLRRRCSLRAKIIWSRETAPKCAAISLTLRADSGAAGISRRSRKSDRRSAS